MKNGRSRALSRVLVKRESPTLVVHDLGRTVFEVGEARIALARTRRKAASLLMYLVTRPNQTATREQVIEELWPDLDPSGAVNSLNQTLYFLRRDIDPWYDDGVSADYVVNESELVWLDPDLVCLDSVGFWREATSLSSAQALCDGGTELLKRFRGQFAPEFEYEEWAISWRERVHSAALLLAVNVARELGAQGRWLEAADSLMSIQAQDPSALEIGAWVVKALALGGASAAAETQYAHFANAYRATLCLEPPTFSEAVAGETEFEA